MHYQITIPDQYNMFMGEGKCFFLKKTYAVSKLSEL